MATGLVLDDGTCVPGALPSTTPPTGGDVGVRQIGSLVLNASGGLAALRWVPGRGDVQWTTNTDGGCSLLYTVCPASLPFVALAMEATPANAPVQVYCLAKGQGTMDHPILPCA